MGKKIIHILTFLDTVLMTLPVWLSCLGFQMHKEKIIVETIQPSLEL